MKQKHTPGPWRATYYPQKEGAMAVVIGQEVIDMPWDGEIRPEWTANARLIAAAPELLGALERAVPQLERFAPGLFRDIATYKEAIRKAIGEL